MLPLKTNIKEFDEKNSYTIDWNSRIEQMIPQSLYNVSYSFFSGRVL